MTRSKYELRIVDALSGLLSDAGSIPAASTIFVGQDDGRSVSPIHDPRFDRELQTKGSRARCDTLKGRVPKIEVPSGFVSILRQAQDIASSTNLGMGRSLSLS